MDEQYCLYNESCMDAMSKMEDDSVDLVLTDPPYNLGLFMKNRATNLKAMRANFFGAAGWDDLEYDEWEKDGNMKIVQIPIKDVEETLKAILFSSSNFIRTPILRFTLGSPFAKLIPPPIPTLKSVFVPLTISLSHCCPERVASNGAKL